MEQIAEGGGREPDAESGGRPADLAERPPAQLEHVLGVELFPRQRGRRLERVDLDEVDLFALPVPRVGLPVLPVLLKVRVPLRVF